MFEIFFGICNGFLRTLRKRNDVTSALIPAVKFKMKGVLLSPSLCLFASMLIQYLQGATIAVYCSQRPVCPAEQGRVHIRRRGVAFTIMRRLQSQAKQTSCHLNSFDLLMLARTFDLNFMLSTKLNDKEQHNVDYLMCNNNIYLIHLFSLK